MDNVKNFKLFGSFLCLLLITLSSACAPVKSLDVWKDEAHTEPLQKVLIIGLAQRENIRNQFENVLSNQLTKRGIEAIASHKVLPQTEEKPDREAVLAKVRELGVSNVLVARSVNRREITNHQYGGVVLGGVAVYSDGGWYGYGYGYSYNREYDTDIFTVSTRLYDVESQQPFWSYISQVKVTGSGEGSINLLIPTVVEQLEASQLIK